MSPMIFADRGEVSEGERYTVFFNLVREAKNL